MSQAASSFDDLFHSDTAPHESRESVRVARWWASWEAWLTFALVVLAQAPVVGSLQSSEWVAEMPSLVLTATIAVVVGWVLSQSRLPGIVAGPLGIVIGAALVVLLVLQRVPLVDPRLGTGWFGHWAEFSLRMQAWFAAVWNQSISIDPLPFVVLLVTLVYLVVFLSCWSVVRWQNAWAALIPGGIILLTNISYLPGQPSMGFIGFLLVSILLVTRMEFLRAGARWRDERVTQPEFMSIEVMFIGAVVAFVLVGAAWIVPTANQWGPVTRVWDRMLEPVSARVETFGQLFVGISSKREVPVHTFGPTLPLQGKIALGGTPLYRVLAAEAGNLRGAAYDEYTGAGWKQTDATVVPLPGTTVQAAEFGTQRTKAEVRQPITAQIEVLTAGAPDRRLLTIGDPLAANVTGRQLVDPSSVPLGVIPDVPASPGKTYTTVGAVSRAAAPTLVGAGTKYPQAIIDTYTEVPATLPPEVADLARQVVGNARSPYEAARRIELYLRRNYLYTLDPPAAPPRRDAVAAFLFDQRAGYFDQFASAMAVMLRTVGVPTRVATGFALDPADVDSTTKMYTVTEQRAWTWPEVYFPNLGWVEFNPTPTRQLSVRPGDDAAAREEADAARAATDEDPAFYDPALDDPGLPATDVDLSAFSDTPFLETTFGRFLVQAVSTLLVLSAGAVVVVVVARVLWERNFRGLRPASLRWAKIQLLSTWAGLAPESFLTPAEAAESLAARIGEAPALRSLARAYTHDRYGRPTDTVPTEDAEADRLADRDYRRVRDQLRRRVVSRLTHLGRVPAAPLARRYSAARATGR